MEIFKTLTSLTLKQILKAGLMFSFLSSALLIANAQVPQAYFTSPANILRLVVALILYVLLYTVVTFFVGYFGEPFVFVYELLTQKILLSRPVFRALDSSDILLFAMLVVGVFFTLSLRDYLIREKRNFLWWLAAWMTVSFFLLPVHSFLQNKPEALIGSKKETSQNQYEPLGKPGSPQPYDGHYAGPNDGYLEVKTNAEGVVTISGQAYWHNDKKVNVGEISGAIVITNGRAFFKDGSCLIDLDFSEDSIIAKEKEGSICGGVNVTFDGKYTKKEEFAIKLLSNEIPTGAYDFVEGKKATCQPEFFDPKTTKFHKVVEERSWPSIMYYLDEEGEEYTHFMINGWKKEGEEKISLLPPYDLNFYKFGCASSFSYFLELSKNNQRGALYSHVVNFGVSADKKYLYLANNVKRAGSRWEKLRRIINIESKESVKLPNINCVSDLGFWDGSTLLTYSDEQEFSPGRKTKTKVCLWGTEGQLHYQLEAYLDWFAGAINYLDSPLGLLPNDNNIFYAFSPGLKDSKCYLILQDLSSEMRRKEFGIIESDPHCPNVQFDFPSFNFDSTEVMFRTVTEDCTDHECKTVYGEWQTAAAESANTSVK